MPQRPASSLAPPRPRQAVSAGDRDKALRSDLVRQVMDVFDARVIDIRNDDEEGKESN